MDAAERLAADARGHRFVTHCNVGLGLRCLSFGTWRADLVPVPGGIRSWLQGGGTGNLVLWGKARIGKTHLAVACLRQLWDAGNESLWFHDAHRVDRDLSRAAGSAAAVLLAGLTESSVLLLDGLERERLDDPSLSLLAQIAECRIRSGRSLLITTRENPNSGPLQETALGPLLRSARQVAGRISRDTPA